ncbi:MAG: helix-turn-helix domain-containing protein [Clostridiales bacterium]|nr:helix-turn-helix domain-containing protein [Clostridiales bacterium]
MNRIKELRKTRNLTQSDFADAMHVHQTAVSQWETGKTNPDMEQAIAIATYFNVTTDYLLGVSDSAAAPPQSDDALADDVKLDDVRYALYGEVRDLSESEAAELLSIVKQVKKIQRGKETKGGA